MSEGVGTATDSAELKNETESRKRRQQTGRMRQSHIPVASVLIASVRCEVDFTVDLPGKRR